MSKNYNLIQNNFLPIDTLNLNFGEIVIACLAVWALIRILSPEEKLLKPRYFRRFDYRRRRRF